MKNKISYKLIVLIFFISAVVTSITTYIHIKEQYEDRLSRFEKSLDNIKKNQLPLLTESVWKVDTTTVNIFLNNLVNSEKIIYAQLIENNETTNKVGKYKENKIIKKEFDLIKKVDEDSYNIGKLVILADLEPLYKDLNATVKNIIFTEVLKMFLLSILIILVMKKLLTNPLEKIAKYAKEINLENLDEPLKLNDKEKNEHNELDIVSTSIDTMRINLKNQIKKNEEKNYMLSQQSKQAVMGEMIGCIAHQWRQPLSMISTASSGIKLSYEAGLLDDERVNDYTRKIINSSEYLSQTIDDFRDFFKPDKDKRNFNISNTFNRVFTLLNTQFTNNNIEIIKQIDEVEVYSFENELIQVIINILNNARDELKKIESQRLLVFIEAFKKDGKLNILIKDNAGGISDDIINRVFEAYFTTKSEDEGTGIGLYMSKKIIEKHIKGELSVQNVDFIFDDVFYNGAEFKIVFDLEK